MIECTKFNLTVILLGPATMARFKEAGSVIGDSWALLGPSWESTK
ncbi:hypothetical protein ACVWY3_000399 [Bradyrhizobium sp. USDA 4486]